MTSTTPIHKNIELERCADEVAISRCELLLRCLSFFGHLFEKKFAGDFRPQVSTTQGTKHDPSRKPGEVLMEVEVCSEFAQAAFFCSGSLRVLLCATL